jgi:NAD(P)-dependent dehydrogenase (short-subunit alcohol dehydrogenase family)
MSLEGKIALVTGATGGIGAATVRLFVARGATVIATDLDAKLLDALAGSLPADKIITLAGDITEEALNSRLVDLALEKFGRLDIAFLNAGIGGELAPTHDYSTAMFEKIMRINCTSVFFGLKYALRAMLGGNGGSIICTSSVQGLQACGYTPGYTAAKHAVMGLVRNAALEYARHNIRVNAVNPGATDTNMMQVVADTLGHGNPEKVRNAFEASVPMGRYARPEDIASMVAYLAADESAYITGMPHVVAGGMTTHWCTPMQLPVN